MTIKEFVMPKRLDLNYVQSTLNDWLNIESYNIEEDDGTNNTIVTSYYERALIACMNLFKFYAEDNAEELIKELSSADIKLVTDVFYKLIKINGWAILEKAYEQECYFQNYDKRNRFFAAMQQVNELQEEYDEELEEIQNDINGTNNATE